MDQRPARDSARIARQSIKVIITAIWGVHFLCIGRCAELNLCLAACEMKQAKMKALAVPECLERRFYKPNGYSIQWRGSRPRISMVPRVSARFVAAEKRDHVNVVRDYRAAASFHRPLSYCVGGYRGNVGRMPLSHDVDGLDSSAIACFVHVGRWHELTAAIDRASQEAAAELAEN